MKETTTLYAVHGDFTEGLVIATWDVTETPGRFRGIETAVHKDGSNCFYRRLIGKSGDDPEYPWARTPGQAVACYIANRALRIVQYRVNIEQLEREQLDAEGLLA